MSEMPNMTPEKSGIKKPPRKKNSSALNVLRNIGAILRHNWWQKLLCFVVAVLLWGIIISQNSSLTRSKTFTDVPLLVQRTQLTTLRQNGFIITSGLEELPTVTFTAEVPQKNYNSVTESNYSVRLDLSQIRQAGVQKVPVISTGSTSYGNVSRLSVDSVEVTVEEYITRSRIPVVVEYASDPLGDWYVDQPKADPSVVSVAGPASIVNQVTRCVARMDLNTITEVPHVELTAAQLQLYSDKTPVDMTNISVGVSGQTTVIDSIIVEQGIYPQFTLPVSREGLLRGKPAEGYRVASVSLSDPELIVALDSDECTQKELFFSGSIDLSGADNTFVRTLTVTRPSGCKHMNRESVRVTVQIEPVEGDLPEAGAGA